MADTPDKPEEEKPENHIPEDKSCERPLECSECRRPISVKYTEIIGNNIAHTCMCSECPELRRRLQGVHHHATAENQQEGATGGLACGECGTTLEALRVGTPLGCSNCYEVFGDILLAEMLEANKVPIRVATNKKSVPIHIGRGPGETQEMNPSLRLLALNEALNETLKREDYEQAAWLRDQIKALTQENPEAPDEGKK